MEKHFGQINLAFVAEIETNNSLSNEDKKLETKTGTETGTEIETKTENENRNNASTNKSEVVKEEDNEMEFKKQIIGGLIGALAYFTVGSMFAYPSSALPSMYSKDTDGFALREDQGVLFSSLLGIGAIAGKILSGPLVVMVGHRSLCLISLPFALAGWIGIVISPNVSLLYVFRLLQGTAYGCLECVYNYIIEITHSSVRGRMTATVDVSQRIGMIFAFSMGFTSLDWRYMALVLGLGSTVIPFIGLFFLHDSPRWLVSKGRDEKAKDSLRFYRGDKFNIEKEYSDIKLQHDKDSKQVRSSLQELKLSMSTSYRRIMIICCILSLVFPFTGDFVFTTYATIIFKDVSPSIDGNICTMILGFMNLVSTLFYISFADRFARKTIFIIPLCISGASLTAIGIFFYCVVDVSAADASITWIPLVLIITISFCINISKSIIFLQRGELLPNSIRAAGLVTTGFCYSIGFFGSLMSYPILVTTIDTYGTFILFSFVCFTVAVFCHITVPETKGKSLEEIQEIVTDLGNNEASKKVSKVHLKNSYLGTNTQWYAI